MPYKDPERNKEYFRRYSVERHSDRKQYARRVIGATCSCGNDGKYFVFKEEAKDIWDFPVKKIWFRPEIVFKAAVHDCELLCKKCFYARRPQKAHGKTHTYKSGCRCDPCTKAYKDTNRKTYLRNREKKACQQ